jgi:hypothetical protein
MDCRDFVAVESFMAIGFPCVPLGIKKKRAALVPPNLWREE